MMNEKRTCQQCETRITEGEDIWGLCETCAAKIDWDALTGKNLKDEAQRIMRAATPNLDLGDINLTEEMRKVRRLIVNQKTTIICDIDGTIANLQHRLHFIKNPDGSKKSYKDSDWDSFHKACVDDEPYEDVIEILHSLVRGHGNGCNVCGAVEREVYFFSGRNESVRKETIEWLEKNVSIPVEDGSLYMRSEGDRRPDTTVKYEMMYELKIMPEDVLCILDDRQSVVNMWRENGFRVMQIDAWKE